MAFFDRVSGKSLEIREPFSVLAEGALAQVLTRSGE